MDAHLVKKIYLKDVYFQKYITIFRHLELEIVLETPASNDKKFNRNNTAGQGLPL